MSVPPAKTICRKCRLEYPGDALFCPNCGTARVQDDPDDAMVGTTIGERYILLERIGQGGSGTIYRAEHVTLRRKVAVKVLHHELSRDDLAIERFRREATTVGQIENDHIVEIFDFGRTGDGRLYLAMELLEGETLADLIEREGQLEVERAVDILVQLGETLMEAHAMGYIHRDLRPRNVFLAIRRGKGRREFVKLLDFGLAKLVEKEGEAASTSLGMTFGDPHYMSPEQARGDALDRRADIYSLGCIAYEMLVGEPPFVGGKVFDILTRHVEATPASVQSRRSDLPSWLDHAVTRMLSKRSDQRFITVFRLIEALRQGSDSGHIMSDDVARRAETVPPASVSQAMARLGARAPADMAVEVSLVPPAPSPRPSARTEAASPEATDPDQPARSADDEELLVGATALGLGVPPSGAAAGGKRAQLAQPGGRAAPATAGSGGLSAAWYADGEAMASEDAPVAGSQQRKLDRARRHSPSNTGIVVQDEEYADGRRPWRLAAIVGGAMLAGAVAAYALVAAQSDGEDSAAEVAQAEEPRAGSGTLTAATAPAPALAPAPASEAVPPAAPAVAATSPEPSPSPSPNPPSATTGESPTPSTGANAGESAGANAAASAGPNPSPPAGEPADSRSKRGSAAARPAGGRRASATAKPRSRFENLADDGALGVKPKPEIAASASVDTGKAEFYARMGDRDLANGDFLGAATNFNKARELDANNATAILGLGEIALSQGSTAAAVSHLRRATKLKPGSARAHTLLGEALLASGRKQLAAASFRRALKIDPADGRARSGLDEAAGARAGDDAASSGLE